MKDFVLILLLPLLPTTTATTTTATIFTKLQNNNNKRTNNIVDCTAVIFNDRNGLYNKMLQGQHFSPKMPSSLNMDASLALPTAIHISMLKWAP